MAAAARNTSMGIEKGPDDLVDSWPMTAGNANFRAAREFVTELLRCRFQYNFRDAKGKVAKYCFLLQVVGEATGKQPPGKWKAIPATI